MQEHCQAPLLRAEHMFSVASAGFEALLTWSASFDPDGPVHRACCKDVCLHLEKARGTGLLEALAQQACSASVVAGLFVCLDDMVRHAMERGLLDHAAGLSVYPTGIS